MRRPLPLAALACLVLLAWDLALESRATERRAALARVGHVLPAERRAELTVAGLRLEAAGGERFTWTHRADAWSGEGFPGVCDGGALQSFLGALADAQGIVVTEDTDEARRYGIAAPGTLVVSLLGPHAARPGGDVLESFEIGRDVPARDSSFVRRRGDRAIWSVDADLRAPLERRVRPELPPFLDPRVIPGSWAGWREGLASLRVEPVGGAPYVLERQPREVTPEGLRAGERPWKWIARSADGEEEAPSADAYAGYLERATWSDVRAAGAPPDPPRGRLVLTSGAGSRLECLFGAREAAGTPVHLPSLGSLVLVDDATLGLLLPEAARVTGATPDPGWQPAAPPEGADALSPLATGRPR